MMSQLFNRTVRSADRASQSCNNCSRAAGELVFHPVEKFGHHGTRFDAEGDGCVQSWCMNCRKEHLQSDHPSVTRTRRPDAQKARRERMREDEKPFWEKVR